jgi:D-sedoheptulose 7-phosphate isomerase
MPNILKQLFDSSDSSGEYIAKYFDRLFELVKGMDVDALGEMVTAIEKASADDKAIFVIGNGGSAATAGHWANDLGPGAHVEGTPGIRVYSLTDAVASLTAVANDAGYENIFAAQLEQLLRPGDLVVAMSVSGNSENIVRGVGFARAHGGYTVGITGFSGGRLGQACDLNIHIPTHPDEYGPVEDVFSILGHAITGYAAMKRGKKLSH